jgi:ATP-dependent RNA helicase DDX54/DBP10
VEYINSILALSNFESTMIYGSMDQTARKINLANFRNGKTKILIVTDLAARGIDIPLLDNVINYDFPSKPKLFVHRVGRVARMGRTGTAYSLVSIDEVCFFFF